MVGRPSFRDWYHLFTKISAVHWLLGEGTRRQPGRLANAIAAGRQWPLVLMRNSTNKLSDPENTTTNLVMIFAWSWSQKGGDGRGFDTVNGEPCRRLARADATGLLRRRLLLQLTEGQPWRLSVPPEIEFPA